VDLRDKVVVVTGASSGIGAACAVRFGREGSKVLVSTDRNEDGARAVVEQIASAGGKAFYQRCDVAEEADDSALIGAAVKRWGRIDILVANAGIQKFQAVEDMDRELWDRIFAVNLTGAALCAKYAVREMKKQGGGSIVNVSSIHDVVTAASLGAYPATKSGMCGLTRVMAIELAPFNIRTNAVLPGYVVTPMFLGDAVRQGNGDPQVFIDRVGQTVPQRRVGQPEEIASVVAFLASDEASYINGVSLLVDGGASIQL
jgi:NAD(P)-dependent dehydrogenase (short-subunit alcohol dehydrogenase family)